MRSVGFGEAIERQWALRRLLESSDGLALCGETARRQGLDMSPRAVQEALVSVTAHATPYYWSAEVLRLVMAGSDTIPEWRLAPEHLPTQFGFCWFHAPWQVRPRATTTADGMLWARVASKTGQGQRVMFWYLGRSRAWPGDVHPLMSFSWGVGETMSARIESLGDSMVFVEDGSMGPGEVDPASDEELRRAGSRLMVRFAASMLAFMDQRILVSHPETAPRESRRRLEKAGWEDPPAVQVVYLRRPASASASGDHGAVDWSCRWIVRGHWRQQWCPAAREHRAMWITPYVKGPEEKPLKSPRSTVFAVVR